MCTTCTTGLKRRLHRQGLSKTAIANRLGMSRNTASALVELRPLVEILEEVATGRSVLVYI